MFESASNSTLVPITKVVIAIAEFLHCNPYEAVHALCYAANAWDFAGDGEPVIFDSSGGGFALRLYPRTGSPADNQQFEEFISLHCMTKDWSAYAPPESDLPFSRWRAHSFDRQTAVKMARLALVASGVERFTVELNDQLPPMLLIGSPPAIKQEDRQPPKDRFGHSDQLQFLIQASEKFWSNADPGDRTTHPENSDVVAWLVPKGFSQSLAEGGATIIRPKWAATGRKPKED